MKNQIYDKKPIKVFLNEKTGISSSIRQSTSDIKFDSKAEYQCYRRIKSFTDELNIIVKKDCRIELNDNTFWNIDFKLIFPMELGIKINTLLKGINDPELNIITPIIYIEYKGRITKQCGEKIDNLLLLPNLNQKTILLGENNDIYENKGRSKKIIAIKDFMLLLVNNF
jgi:hypothetical protein